METEQDLNQKITEITGLIQEKYPELSKFISEMTVTIPDAQTPDIRISHLREYYNSLMDMVKKYALEHNKTGIPSDGNDITFS